MPLLACALQVRRAVWLELIERFKRKPGEVGDDEHPVKYLELMEFLMEGAKLPTAFGDL